MTDGTEKPHYNYYWPDFASTLVFDIQCDGRVYVYLNSKPLLMRIDSNTNIDCHSTGSDTDTNSDTDSTTTSLTLKQLQYLTKNMEQYLL